MKLSLLEPKQAQQHISTRKAQRLPYDVNLWLIAMWPLPLGSRQLGSEVGHSPPLRANVKNAWNYTSIPSHAFIAWYLTMQSGDFTPTLRLGQ
jgi:hypothetical protein